MKRFLAFLVLGPVLGHLMALLVIMPVVIVFEGRPIRMDIFELALITLPYGYLFGVLPAFLTFLVDYLFRRTAWTIVAGVAFTLPVLWLTPTFKGLPNMLLAAMCIGGVAAAVCSRLVAWAEASKVGVRNRERSGTSG